MKDEKITVGKVLKHGRNASVSIFGSQIMQRGYYLDGKLYHVIGGYPKSQYFQYPDTDGKPKLVSDEEMKKFGLESAGFNRNAREEYTFEFIEKEGKPVGRIVSDIFQYKNKYYRRIMVIDEAKCLLLESRPNEFAEFASPYELSFFKINYTEE